MRISIGRNQSPAGPLEGPSIPAVRKETSGGGGRGPARILRGVTAAIGGRPLLTVSVDHDAVRAVLFKKDVPIAWKTVPVAGRSLEVRDLEQALKGLGHRHAGYARVISELPLASTPMRRISLPKVSRGNLTRVLTTIVLESLPFEEGEVDLAWRTWKTDSGNEAFVIATPKGAVDRRFGDLRQAGMTPSAIYTRAIALASIASTPEAVVVWAGRTAAELVVVKDGLPRTVHEVRLPGDVPDSVAEPLARAVVQATTYGQAAAESSRPAVSLPVVLTGPLARDPAITASLGRQLRREVLSPDIPEDWPEEFPAAEYSVNIGLTRARTMAKDRKGSVVSQAHAAFSVLSDRHRENVLPLAPIATFAVLAVFAADAYGFTVLVTNAESKSRALEVEAAAQVRQARENRLTQSRYLTLDQQAEDLALQVDAMESQLVFLQDDFNLFASRIDLVTAEAIPAGAAVTSFSSRTDGFLLAGSAPSHDDVLQFTENLRASGLFNTVIVTRVDQSNPTGAPAGAFSRVSFQIRAYIEKVHPGAAAQSK